MNAKKTTNYDRDGKYMFDDERIVGHTGKTEKQIHDEKLARAAKKEQDRFDRPMFPMFSRATSGVKTLTRKVQTALKASAKAGKGK